MFGRVRCYGKARQHFNSKYARRLIQCLSHRCCRPLRRSEQPRRGGTSSIYPLAQWRLPPPLVRHDWQVYGDGRPGARSAAAPCDHRPRARLRCSGARVRAGRLSARARASSQVWYNYNSGSLASLVPVDGFGQLRSHGAAPMAAAFSGDGCVARLRISSTSSSLSLSGGRLGILETPAL